MTLYCTIPRLEAALADGPHSAPCPNLATCPSASPACRVFAPGWWCDDCGCCVFPDLIRGDDDEPDADYS
jgi:hypothetical protein